MINKLFNFDENFVKKNSVTIVGVDEVGRGPGAGPVYACAYSFFMDFEKYLSDCEILQLEYLNDSKKISEKRRIALSSVLKKCGYYSFSFISPSKIDKINILNASLLAMKSAVLKLLKNSDIANPYILVDGNKLIKSLGLNQNFLIKGDAKSASIAAASIIAKVTRDNYMVNLSKKFPAYDFENNKGYLTPNHIAAIKKYGATKHHRKTFIKSII